RARFSASVSGGANAIACRIRAFACSVHRRTGDSGAKRIGRVGSEPLCTELGHVSSSAITTFFASILGESPIRRRQNFQAPVQCTKCWPKTNQNRRWRAARREQINRHEI